MFAIPTNELVELIDVGWAEVKNNALIIIRATGNDTISYSIPMGRTIGTQGGKKGNDKGLDRLRIVIDGQKQDHIVTAFPELLDAGNQLSSLL